VRKSDITYIVGSVFAAMTGFFYCCITWFGIKLPRYYPLEHTWKRVKEQGIPSQAWYAKQAFAYICAGVTALILYFVLRRWADKAPLLSPTQTKTLGVVVTLIVIICMGYILYYEFDKWGVFASMGLQ
jgi:hypothetical protein